jgi:hypothetical protein
MLAMCLVLVLAQQAPQSSAFEEKRLSVIPPDCIYEGHATFAPNGSAVAYIVNRGGKKEEPEGSVIHGGKYHVIVNGKEGEGFFQISGTWGLEISLDGSQVAYSANLGNHKCVAVVNDRKYGTKFEDASFPRLSLDGKRMGFWVRDGTKQAILIGGERALESETPLSFEGFSPDGSSYAAIGSRFIREVPCPIRVVLEYKHFLMLGGRKAGEEYDWIEGFRFSPDGKTFAYIAHEGIEKPVQHLIVGDKPGPGFEQVRRFTFSADGKQVAYSARNGSRPRVMLGDRDLSEDYDYADHVGFSPDGKEVSFVAEHMGKHYLVAGRRRWEIEGTVTWHPTVFSTGGKHVAYVAWSKRGGDYVGVDDQEGEFCDRIYTPPVFSADGRKVAYGALKGREFWWKVLNVK